MKEMKGKSIGGLTLLAILLTVMITLAMPAIAQEDDNNTVKSTLSMSVEEQENDSPIDPMGNIFLSGENYGIKFKQGVLPSDESVVVIVGIIPSQERFKGVWQRANNSCEPETETFIFSINENMNFGEYDIIVIVFQKTDFCDFLSHYGIITIRGVQVVSIEEKLPN